MRGQKRVLLAGALLAFLLPLFRPAYTSLLRSRRAAPSSFSLMVPQIFSNRFHDEANYAARVKQVLLHGRPVNPYLRDERGVRSWLHDFIVFYAMAVPAALAGGDMTRAWILSLALVNAAWWASFFLLFRWWTRGREDVAAPLAFFSVLFPDLYEWLLDVNFNWSVNVERWVSVFWDHPSAMRPNFQRLPSPFLGYLVVCGVMALAWKLAGEKRPRPGRALGVGLAFGALLWVHPPEFGFAMATLTVFAAVLFLREPRSAGRWNMPLAFGAGFACFVGFILLSRGQSLEFLSTEKSRKFFLTSLVHLLVGGVALWRLRAEREEPRRLAWLLLGAAQLAAFLCRNMQVVTGLMVQPFHYITFGSFFGGVMLFLLGAERLAAARRWGPRAALASIGALCLWGLSADVATARRVHRLFGLPEHVEQALAWTRASTPKDALFASLSMEANMVLPLHTSAKVMIPPIDAPFSFGMPKEEYLRRTASLLNSAGADADKFLRARWVLPAERRAVVERLVAAQRAGEPDFSELEPAAWFYDFGGHGNETDGPVLEGRARLKELVKETEAAPRPYWLWVAAADRRLLARSPEKNGGALVYENPGISIYEFRGAAASSR